MPPSFQSNRSTVNQKKVAFKTFNFLGYCEALSLKESACETRKNSYVTLKALFIPQKVKFQNFRYSNLEYLLDIQDLPKYMYVCKICMQQSLNETVTKIPDPFVLAKNQAQLLLVNEIFETSYLYQIFVSKTIKISPNQQADLILYTYLHEFTQN